MKISRVDSFPVQLRTMDFSFAIDEQLIEPFDAGAGRHRCLMIAENADAIIGYAVAEKAWNNCAEVSEFAVAREFRRLGVATAPMTEIVTWAKSMRLPAIGSKRRPTVFKRVVSTCITVLRLVASIAVCTAL